MKTNAYCIALLALFLGSAARADTVKIVDAKALKTADTWTIAVTLNHPDVDMNHYADSWRVVADDGTVLGTRKLLHPHSEQPFTRDLRNVSIPAGTATVYIEAHCKVQGWAKQRFELRLTGEPRIGDPAPAFTALDQDGKPWRLADHLDGKYLVLYFYPAAMTGGCTKQACSYRDYIKQTGDQPFEVVGISGDTPRNLRYFRQAESLNFTLLSDPDGTVAKAFGVPVKSGEKSISRTVAGKEVQLSRSATTARWTFIIDAAGKIVYRDNAVKPTLDIENILTFLKRSSTGRKEHP